MSNEFFFSSFFRSEIYESYFDHHKDDRSKIYTDIDGLLKHL